jgi:RHS repeat-associated protein
LQVQVPTNATNSAPQTTKYTYAGDTVTVTDADNNLKTMVSDPNGRLRQVTDAASYSVNLGYDAAGSADSVTDNLSNTLWTATYQYGADAYPVAINDADLGPWTYTFNALGENTSWVDAKGQQFSQTYDALSRPITRREPDLYTQWTWGASAAANNIGRLQSVCTGTGTNPTACTSSGYSQSRTYDNLERPSQFSIAIPGDATYTYTATYNGTTGYLDTLTYPSTSLGPSLQVKFAYVNGALQSLTNVTDSPNVTFWTANQVDQMGAASQETFGNGVVLNHAFDAVTFRPSAITAGPGGGAALQNNSYLFDGVGNLTQRQDNNAGTTESVFYDSLNRLGHTVGDTSTTMSYDGMGRLTTWSANGNSVNTEDYATPQSGCTYYNNSQPHAVRKSTQGSFIQTFCYDANGNLTVHNITGSGSATQNWTSFNQPSLTTSPFGSSQFLYNHNHQRWQQIASFSGSPETTTYIGGLLEKVVNSQGTAYRHYIPAGNTFVEYVRSTATGNSTYYVTQDHLGSTAAITDHTGALVVNEKYSALGWNENTAAQETTFGNITRHEYTGQEGVDSTGVGIVNLNKRLYSPSGAYFFSPDPNTPDVTDTRSYNRYAYASYNPLTRIDPSGRDDEDFGDDGSGSDDGSGDPCNDCQRPEDSTPPPREVVQDPDGRTWLCVLTPGCILILQDPASSPDTSTPPAAGPDNTPPSGDPNPPAGQNPPDADGSGGLPPIFGGGGSGIGATPPGPASIAPNTPPLVRVGLDLPKLPGYNISLTLHELAGGHTIAMHVAKSLDFLRRRTMGDDPLPAASTFLSLGLARSLINMTLNYNRAKIAAMMAIEGKASATIFTTFDKPTGYRYEAGKGNIATVYSVFIVLQKPAVTPEGFLVFTAFPVPP